MRKIKKILILAVMAVVVVFPSAVYAGGGEKDTGKPTVNASIADGYLNIQAEDAEGGIYSIFVNDEEYTSLREGSLTIRLQLYDSGIQLFKIRAKDTSGNMSDVFQIKNPYYKDAETEDEDEKEEGNVLPPSALPSVNADSKATVTGHSYSGTGTKEFYSITTDEGKVFYLIIDMSQSEDNALLLTEVNENDLLSVTGINYEVLPQNSAEKTAAAEQKAPEAEAAVIESSAEESITETPSEEETEETENNKAYTYLVVTVICLIVLGVWYFMKRSGKKDDFIEDPDDEEEEEDEDAGFDEDDFDDFLDGNEKDDEDEFFRELEENFDNDEREREEKKEEEEEEKEKSEPEPFSTNYQQTQIQKMPEMDIPEEDIIYEEEFLDDSGNTYM